MLVERSHCSIFTSASTRFSSFNASSKRSSPSAHIHTDDHCNDKTDVQIQWTTQGKRKGVRAPGWCGNWHPHQLPPEVSTSVQSTSKDDDLLPFPRMTSKQFHQALNFSFSHKNGSKVARLLLHFRNQYLLLSFKLAWGQTQEYHGRFLAPHFQKDNSRDFLIASRDLSFIYLQHIFFNQRSFFVAHWNENPFKRYVEIGRVAQINYGKEYGRLVVIVDVIDQNRALVDAPDMVRSQVNFKRLSLTDIKIDIKRVPKKKDLIQAMDAADVKNRWEKSSWGRKLIVQKRRASLNDFDRFKIMLAKIKRAAVVRQELAKLKKSAS
ncbi:hypothetical protein LR48_Vigan02g005200 [Vigna angularis]|uniref:Large ribosomal subunit protein eL14 domain-containing protein n=1 Tax=Phaseolus angularis TaxID=3914 RepID=A0A0L9TU12_PHAAN|nr:hypothetical protein LR48_Vigan02g005200 [Vigna angularis]